MAIESATNDLKKALESNDAKSIDRTLDALMQAQQKAGENLYAVGRRRLVRRGPRVRQAAPGGNGQADDVIDAEVVEEKK